MKQRAIKPEICSLSFTLGNTGRSNLWALLYNLYKRSTVDGRIECRINGELQRWWEEDQDRIEARAIEWAREEAERVTRERNIANVIRVNLEKTDEELAQLLDLPASWIPARRKIVEWQLRDENSRG